MSKNNPEDIKKSLTVKVTAKSIHKRNYLIRITLIIIIVLLLLLSTTYGLLYIANENGSFTIELDPSLKGKRKMLISASSDFEDTPLILKTDALEYMDNISERWIPDDVDDIEGPHSKDNYLAYTFFVKNTSDEEMEYMTEINILSVVKNVDEAVRVAVYKNGEKTVYAKKNSETNKPEENTVAFASSTQVMSAKQTGLKKDSTDKYTVVIWLEGDDPDCINEIMGGAMKFKMLITEVQKYK